MASKKSSRARAPGGFITIEGARQNNLRNLSLRLPLRKLIVITGVSGSGKSSLAFDTLYSEGQRRYVETFSSYTRQFLDRMDKPRVDRIEGIPPAIAIDQTNPVRTSRSTVGTMTELNDHLKLLFARASRLYCGNCGREVRRDTPETIVEQLPAGKRLLLTFPVTVPDNFTEAEVLDLLSKQGYTRIHAKEGKRLEVLQDRVTMTGDNRGRVVEDIEAALKYGQGRVSAHLPDGTGNGKGSAVGSADGEILRFSSDLHCAFCDIHYDDPTANLFSFNSPVGACATCRGFGRTIGIDWNLVVPDETKTLAAGAVRPWQTASFADVQDELMKFARRRGIPTDVPWGKLTAAQRAWVIDGEGEWDEGLWFGARRFFKYLETKSYRMHIRVLLSKYRAYTPCPDCGGARLKPEALRWKIGSEKLSLHDVMLLPIDRCLALFQGDHAPRSHGRGHHAAGVRDQDPPALPGGRGAGLPHPGPPVPHPERRGGAEDQSHHRAGNLAGERAVRPGRAERRAASPGHRQADRRAPPPARHGKHHRGRGARSRRDPRGRPRAGHGPGRRRAGRTDRFLRRPRGAHEEHPLPHRAVPHREEEGGGASWHRVPRTPGRRPPHRHDAGSPSASSGRPSTT